MKAIMLFNHCIFRIWDADATDEQVTTFLPVLNDLLKNQPAAAYTYVMNLTVWSKLESGLFTPGQHVKIEGIGHGCIYKGSAGSCIQGTVPDTSHVKVLP